MCETINFSHVFTCSYATVLAIETVQLSPTSVVKRLLLLSMIVGFGDIMNLNADWKSLLVPPPVVPLLCWRKQKPEPWLLEGSKRAKFICLFKSCSSPSNKANLTDFQAGRTSQKFHYFAELAAVLLMFTRHRKGGVEKGMVGWKISTG